MPRLNATTVTTLEDMQKLVGGLICLAWILPNGDELYVNDEGLLRDEIEFFRITYMGSSQTFAGDGFISGPVDKDGNMTDVQLTMDVALELISFGTYHAR